MFGVQISLKEQIKAETQGGTPADGKVPNWWPPSGCFHRLWPAGGKAGPALVLAFLASLQESSGSSAGVLGYKEQGQVWVGMSLRNSWYEPVQPRRGLCAW